MEFQIDLFFFFQCFVKMLLYCFRPYLVFEMGVYDLHHSSQHHQIPDPPSEARDGTHILIGTSCICFHCATMGTPPAFKNFSLLLVLSSHVRSCCLFCFLKTVSFLFSFFAFQGHPCGIWRFPGQGSHWSCSCWLTPQPQPHRIRATSATLHHSSQQCQILNPLSKAMD